MLRTFIRNCLFPAAALLGMSTPGHGGAAVMLDASTLVPGQIVISELMIDPAKVTRTALTSAASVAGLLLTTECAINDLPEDRKEPGGNPGMGMM